MSVCVIWWVAGPVVVILVVIYSYFIFLSVQSHDGGLRRATQRDVFKVVLVYLALFLPNSHILILSPICSVPPTSQSHDKIVSLRLLLFCNPPTEPYFTPFYCRSRPPRPFCWCVELH